MNIPLDVAVREYDELSMFFGMDYVVNDKIKIKHPKIREIVEFGEREYFNFIYSICSIPSDMKSVLWDMGFDYEQVSDFQLFAMLSQTMSDACSKFVFYDIDISKFEWVYDTVTEQPIFISPDRKIVIDQRLYRIIID